MYDPKTEPSSSGPLKLNGASPLPHPSLQDRIDGLVNQWRDIEPLQAYSCFELDLSGIGNRIQPKVTVAASTDIFRTLKKQREHGSLLTYEHGDIVILGRGSDKQITLEYCSRAPDGNELLAITNLDYGGVGVRFFSYSDLGHNSLIWVSKNDLSRAAERIVSGGDYMRELFNEHQKICELCKLQNLELASKSLKSFATHVDLLFLSIRFAADLVITPEQTQWLIDLSSYPNPLGDCAKGLICKLYYLSFLPGVKPKYREE